MLVQIPLWKCASCAATPTWTEVSKTGSAATAPGGIHADQHALTFTHGRGAFILTIHTLTITSEPSGTPNPVASGETANLSVTAVDSLGHALSYNWSASCPTLGGNGTFSNAAVQTPSWTAPANTTGSQFYPDSTLPRIFAPAFTWTVGALTSPTTDADPVTSTDDAARILALACPAM